MSGSAALNQAWPVLAGLTQVSAGNWQVVWDGPGWDDLALLHRALTFQEVSPS